MNRADERAVFGEPPVEPGDDAVEREARDRKRTLVEHELVAVLVEGRGNLTEREAQAAYGHPLVDRCGGSVAEHRIRRDRVSVERLERHTPRSATRLT